MVDLLVTDDTEKINQQHQLTEEHPRVVPLKKKMEIACLGKKEKKRTVAQLYTISFNKYCLHMGYFSSVITACNIDFHNVNVSP